METLHQNPLTSIPKGTPKETSNHQISTASTFPVYDTTLKNADISFQTSPVINSG